MGYAMSWMGIQGREQADVFAELGLVDSGEVYRGREPCAWAISSTGWLILASKNVDYVSKARLEKISRDALAVGAQIDDRVMVSGARAYRDGFEIWSISHDPEKGLSHLDIEGSPPSELEPILEPLRASQAAEGGDDAEVDFVFEAPAALTATICGYRPDEGEPLAFTGLVAIGEPGTGILSRLRGLFRRR